MRNIIIAVVVIMAFIIIKSNIGYFMYDGSARSASKIVQHHVAQPAPRMQTDYRYVGE